MLNQSRVFAILKKAGVNFFTGVPDSYLNGFCHFALANCGAQNIIAANEGNAVGIAAGHYLASGRIPLVYMQNSGMGNAVNPLVSLADPLVYGTPMLLLIGWRGQGNTEPNHPQHSLQGEITPGLLELMHIPYRVLEDDEEHFARTVEEATAYCRRERRSFGLIAPKGVMADPDKPNNVDDVYPMSREEAMEVVLDHMPDNTIYAATTGRATRELFFLREKRGETRARDFLNVGSMGHASSVALGMALEKPQRPVVVLDGDSAALMHLGALSMVSKVQAPNLMHIVLNNGAHESVGGQPSAGHRVDFTGIARACGYETHESAVTNREDLIRAITRLRNCGRASFIDCRIHKGLSRKLPPIIFDHKEAIDALMATLREE